MNHSKVLDRCGRSTKLSSNIWQILIGRDPPADPRDALALAAAALAHEHHASIVTLVATEHYASAAALIRPLIEAGLSGTWLLYCASEERAFALQNGVDEFLPKPKRMWAECSAHPLVGEGMTQLQMMMDGVGIIFHKFTHGDMPQLSRRFVDGVRRVPFSEGENLVTLINADLFLLGAGDIAGMACKSLEGKGFLREMLYSTAQEACYLAGKEFVWQEPWNGLPRPEREE